MRYSLVQKSCGSTKLEYVKCCMVEQLDEEMFELEIGVRRKDEMQEKAVEIL